MSTLDLAKEWLCCTELEKRLLRDLDSAREQMRKAELALAAAIVPDDMHEGEQIGVWVRFGEKDERLVVVCKSTTRGLHVHLREKSSKPG